MASPIYDSDHVDHILSNISVILPYVNERQRRLIIGALSDALGYGGKSAISEKCGVARNTVRKSDEEFKLIIADAAGETSTSTETETKSDEAEDSGTADTDKDSEMLLEATPEQIVGLYDGSVSLSSLESRQRRAGGGRKSEAAKNPELIPALMEILDDYTYGNPESVLLYTNLSDRKLSAMLAEKGYSVGRNVVNRMLKALGWSKQQNKKLKQVGKEHPDRNVQFEFINATGKEVLAAGNPMISIDCKKKENIGDYANKGKEYRHSKDPRAVLDHDFLDKELGQVAPYGVYVVNNNTGFVNLGTTHDTSQFAVASIRAWWYTVGKNTFPDATMIYITCDGGGSNSSRVRMFKTELAKLVEEIGIPIQISHFPPGTSKWNKVEHRLFSEISKSWAGKPLISVETVVQLIGSTTTTTGLKVTCQPDYNDYKTGLKASEEEYDKVDIEWINIGTSNKWNYIIHGLKKDS